MSLSLKQLGIYLGLLALGGGAGVWGNRYLMNQQQNAAQPQILPMAVQPSALQPSSAPQENLNFIAKAVQKVGPAVVRIDAARQVSQQVPEPFRQPFFRRFFGNELPVPRERVERGTGSGFILSSNGRMITNAHVVEGVDKVKVTLKDGQIFEGQVLGTDPITDVAVVKIDADNLPTVTLGKAENLIPGEWAIAIGNPFGLDNTVTVGIISALDRSSSEVGVPDKRVRFIQTDAAINPGNSGGPLLNADGQVIGINTAIRANAQGLGFAIPIETAQRIAEQLFAKGKADHPYLGIQMIALNQNRRKEINQDGDFDFNVTQDKGVLIVRVIRNSPAERAGFQPGDIIQKVGGQPVETAAQVQEQVEVSQIGEVLEVEVIRNGETKIIKVLPGAFPLDQFE
ncbi:MAG: HhoA/HhoB/HtrA family serine endopeptidase [Xenococcaceae cyanobacterium]